METEITWLGTKKDAWIETYTGRRFNVFEPDIRNINIMDIAHSLSMCTRFNGHLNQYYSVAEHSIYVSELVPKEFALAGLLHDASEAYLSDVPRPIKAMIPEIKLIENNVITLIFKKYGVTEYSDIITYIDRSLCLTEAVQSNMNTYDWIEGSDDYDLQNITLSYLPWSIAKQDFLNLFDKLTRGKFAYEYK
jgi:hypothetical protein